MLEEHEILKLKQLKEELKAARSDQVTGGNLKGAKKLARRKHRVRELPSDYAEMSPAQRNRLANQGTRGAGDRDHHPGAVLSVQLVGCGHRVRVEALATGQVPGRARCQRCGVWGNADLASVRGPVVNVTREVVGRRVEERDGRVFRVEVLRTPRRARVPQPYVALATGRSLSPSAVAAPPFAARRGISPNRLDLEHTA